MSLKNSILCTVIGGAAVIGYLKYKDGTLERYIKNMKPMMKSALEDLKNGN